MRSAHQVSLELGQAALRKSWVLSHQCFADQETEDRISEKFELFVIGGRIFGALFVDPGFVRERAFQQFPILEGMSENFLEGFQVRAHRLPAKPLTERREAWIRRPSSWLPHPF